MKRDQAVERVAETLQQMIGSGMIGLQLFENLVRRFRGIDFLGDGIERGLILTQIGPADFEQAIERRIHHLVVEKFLRKCLRANAKITIRARQQIRLQPFFITFKRGDDGGVRLRKLGLDRGSATSLNADGTSF